MDFMNLNQSAHGDREHGFIGSRLRMARKVIVGYWEDEEPQTKLANWMRSACGYAISQELKMVRFSDNMRQVAVTEGDKVEAEIKFGWDVEYRPIGDIVDILNEVTETEIDAKMAEYESRYTMDTDNIDAVRYQAKEEIAIRKKCVNSLITVHSLLILIHCTVLTNFPGLAAQNMMADGYGFGAEGDWKVAAMDVIMKSMAEGMTGGTAFMEDYIHTILKRVMNIFWVRICSKFAQVLRLISRKFRCILSASAVRAILQDLYLTQRTVTQSLLHLLIWAAECV